MTPSEFISEIEGAWDKELSARQVIIWKRKLEFLGEWQLNDLLEKVVETCRYFPKFADVWTAARELGFFEEADRKSRTTSIHTWKPTGCPLCGGDGRLTVFMAMLYETDDTGRRERLQLRRIFRASDGASIEDYEPQSEERSFLFRCACPAGDAESLPQSWPRWKNTEGYRSRGKLDKQDPAPGQLEAVQSLVDTAKKKPERTTFEEEEVPF